MPPKYGSPNLATLALLAVTALLTVSPAPAYADAVRDKQWHLSHLNASKLHSITAGEGVTVAVIDSGVEGEHPDLAGNVRKGKDLVQAGDGWNDTDGHGTAMASLIAGHGHGPHRADGVLGLAPDATILPIRRSKGGELPTDDDHSAAGIRWAVDHGADVISMSCGCTDLDLRDAVTYAQDHDVLIVAAAGNTTQHSRRVAAPARYPGVIAVSGTDQQGRFSETSIAGDEVVLAAPAVGITTAGAASRGGYSTGTGTSNSTALVAAAAALIRAEHPKLNAPSVIQRLIRTAHDQGPKGRDPRYGYGTLSPLDALTANIAPVANNPLLSPTNTAPDTTSPSTHAPPHRPGRTPSRIAIAFGVALGAAIAAAGIWLTRRRR